MWSGAAQFLLITLFLIVQFKMYFVARSQLLAPHLAGSNETGQAIVTVIVALEFVFHPLSLFLLYLALEGAVRFIGGLITAEIVPSLPVFLFFKISDSRLQAISRCPSRPPIADSLVRLPDGRVRIASATPKAGWNASVTIGIDGQWFEVECEDQAQPPHSHVYVLRPAPPEKILRGYQEYDAPSAMNASSTVEPSTGTDLS